MFLINIHNLVAFVVREDGRKLAHRLVAVGFLQQLDGLGDGGAAAVGVVRHLVQPKTVVFVLKLTERLHRRLHIVVDDGMAVTVVAERLPSGAAEGLGVVHNLLHDAKDGSSSQRGEGVEVQPDEQIGVIGHQGCQLVVHVRQVELQLVVLLVVEVEVVVAHGEHRRVVVGVIDRTAQLEQAFAHERVLLRFVLLNCDVHRTVYALLLLILKVRPRTVVHKLVQRRLKGLEHTRVRTLYLTVDHLDLAVQLLCVHFNGE